MIEIVAWQPGISSLILDGAWKTAGTVSEGVFPPAGYRSSAVENPNPLRDTQLPRHQFLSKVRRKNAQY